MALKQTITELDFAEFVCCPLRSTSTYQECDELEAAKGTLQWLLLNAFNDRLVALGDIRAAFEAQWKRIYNNSPMTQTDCRRGLKSLPRYCKRLQDLVTDYMIMYPVTHYTLPFGRNTVQGEYAVLTKPKTPVYPLVLRLRFGTSVRTEVHHRGPDMVNMLRWMHFRQWEVTRPLVQVLNFSIDTEDSWLDFFNEKTVHKYLNHASSNLADKRLFPSPGPHCETCKLSSCLMDAMEVFPTNGSGRHDHLQLADRR